MVLVIVMIVATLLLIALTAALPSVYQEGQREREEELIFRGTQYARAVALFHKKFNRYPVDTKELLQTNGMRFLRKEFLDPMDPKGKWRFIHISASGVLLDSVNQPLRTNQSNPAGLGANPSSPPSSTSGGGFSLGGSNIMAAPAPRDFNWAIWAWEQTRPREVLTRSGPLPLSLEAKTKFRAPTLLASPQPANMSPSKFGISTTTIMSGSSSGLTWESLESESDYLPPGPPVWGNNLRPKAPDFPRAALA